MADGPDPAALFVTVAMAEILLSQNMLDEAGFVIDELVRSDPENPRFLALRERLRAIESQREAGAVPIDTKGGDSVTLERLDQGVRVSWELTEASLALAKRQVRYAGQVIVRIFQAVPGPRGVRTSTRDLEVDELAARVDLVGLPSPAVHVAAVGFVARTGEFLPMATSAPLVVQP